MGKKSAGGGTKKSGVSKTSSGKRRLARWGTALRRVEMKIARFERYKVEGKQPAKKSARLGWDTAGLKRHAEMLRACIAKGPVCKV